MNHILERQAHTSKSIFVTRRWLQGEWNSAWMGHYEYAAGYAEQGMYTDADGYTYYQQVLS